MNPVRDIPVEITPQNNIIIALEQGEQCSATIDLSNASDQKILVKLRSNAGKVIRMKHGYLALNAKDSLSLEVYLTPKTVDEYIQKFQEGKQTESFKLQFNFIFISDIMFDKITKLPEEDQISEMAAVWSSARKSDVQQIVKTIVFSCKSSSASSRNPPITPKEERLSDESLQSCQPSDIINSMEYQKLKKQYNALCVVFKRCQDVIKSQEESKGELQSQLQNKESEMNALRLELQNKPISKTMPISSSVRPAVTTAITVFTALAAFVLGFVAGQFATKLLWK